MQAAVITACTLSWSVLSCVRQFVRRQISQYLESHIQLPPKAIVLMALVETSGATQQQQHSVSTQGIHLQHHALTTSTAAVRDNVNSGSSSSGGGGSSRSSHPISRDRSSSSGVSCDGRVGGSDIGPASPNGREYALVGTAEVSFSDTTRSTYLTLNPPKVRDAWHQG